MHTSTLNRIPVWSGLVAALVLLALLLGTPARACSSTGSPAPCATTPSCGIGNKPSSP